MKLRDTYSDDIAYVLSKRHANGGDLWTTADGFIGKGGAFSTGSVALLLVELGFRKKDSLLQELAQIFFDKLRPDGRFRISQSGAIYPCHTIGCLRILCQMGYANESRLEATWRHLQANQQNDGGWMCAKYSFGRGPTTQHSNPGPTLEALDALRLKGDPAMQPCINAAVDFLLWHWEVKIPVGPCQFGMGTLFHQTEFPFFRYNLFYYAYVLSFFEKARKDPRFLEAYACLKSKLRRSKIPVENPNHLLAHLEFCKKDQPSFLATKRFKEIEKHVKSAS